MLPKYTYCNAIIPHMSQQTTLSRVQLYAAHRDLPRHDLVAAPVAKHAIPLYVIMILTVVSWQHSACFADVVPRTPLL